MLSTRVRTLTVAHAWRRALLSSAIVERGSSMSWIQTNIWFQTCSIGYLSGLRADQSYVQTPPSPMATFDSSGSGCTDDGSWLHPTWPAHSSPHDGLHSIPWLTSHVFHHYTGRRHQSAFPLAYGAPRPDCHCGLGRIRTHHWRCSISIACVPTLCASSPTHAGVACDQYPVARSHLWIVRNDIRLPNWRIICIRRRGAEWRRFVLTILSSLRSSHGTEIFIEPPRILWCGLPVSLLLIHPWDTPSILATSCWELPSANNLTICCSICSGKFCVMIPFKRSKKYL